MAAVTTVFLKLLYPDQQDKGARTLLQGHDAFGTVLIASGERASARFNVCLQSHIEAA
jgi:hypothetical protein